MPSEDYLIFFNLFLCKDAESMNRRRFDLDLSIIVVTHLRYSCLNFTYIEYYTSGFEFVTRKKSETRKTRTWQERQESVILLCYAQTGSFLSIQKETPYLILDISSGVWQGRQESNPYLRFWRPLY